MQSRWKIQGDALVVDGVLEAIVVLELYEPEAPPVLDDTGAIVTPEVPEVLGPSWGQLMRCEVDHEHEVACIQGLADAEDEAGASVRSSLQGCLDQWLAQKPKSVKVLALDARQRSL
jgi:hypothetical protein